MTKKESKKALELYNKLNSVLFYHNKNLTKSQEWLLQDIYNYLREISEKAYQEEKEDY